MFLRAGDNELNLDEFGESETPVIKTEIPSILVVFFYFFLPTFFSGCMMFRKRFHLLNAE